MFVKRVRSLFATALVCATGIGYAWAQAPGAAPGAAKQPQQQPQFNPNRGVLFRYPSQAPDVRLAFQQKPELIAVFAFTDEQVNQFAQSVQAINPDALQQEMRQKMQDPNLTPEGRQKLQQELNEKRRAMEQEIASKLESIMTPEQKALRQKIANASKAAEQAMKTALEQSLSQSLSEEEKKRLEAASQRGQPRPAAPKPAAQ